MSIPSTLRPCIALMYGLHESSRQDRGEWRGGRLLRVGGEHHA